jgi:glycosyltransferase involved in cell wall biosynthesis
MYEDKKRWFTSVKNMTIVSVSNWLADEVRQSFLAKYPVVLIYNWIDQNIFGPRDRRVMQSVRKRYGLTEDAFVVLGVSAGWSNHKSSSSAGKLHDFCQLSQMLRNPMQLVLVGHAKDPACIPNDAVHIPYVHDLAELAAIYNMADVYVHLSMEDTFGKVIAEALACGTPAVVYDSTACPEGVGEGCGFVVEARNVDEVHESLVKIHQTGKQAYSRRCVAFSESTFNYRNNTEAHLDLYRKVLHR